MTELELSQLKLQFFDLAIRATGRTTRLVDEIIQKMYNNQGQWVDVADHYGTAQSHKMLLTKIRRRMENEHPSDVIEINTYRKVPKIRITRTMRDGVLEELDRLREEIRKTEEENGSK